MSVLKTLRERVAPELNFLYLVPPSEPATGFDCGWRGREHALHTFLVARLFGAEAELCHGDFAVISQSLPPLTTMEREPDHGWCIVNGVAPVDLSVSFQHFGQAPQLRSPITGEGRNGDWQIQYAQDESALDEGIQNPNEIVFIEKESISVSAIDLVENPHLFLTPPAAEDAKHWHTLYGPSICAKISWHCFRCANGEAKSARSRSDRDEAVAWINQQYPAAEVHLRAKLA